MHNVAVIGAGVVGLTTAVELQKQYGSTVNVTIFAEKLTPETTGDVSAGLWLPYILQNTPEESVNKWSQRTMNYFEHLWRTGYASQAGISLVPTYLLSNKESSDLPSWSTIPFGCTKLSKEQLERFCKDHKQNYKEGITFVTFTCEPKKFLPFLMDKFLKNGGRLRTMKITDFRDLEDFDCIVNCTGLNAQELAQDNAVQPVRGQITRVKAPWMNYCFMDDDNYIIPNTDSVILGGTKQIGNYNLEVDENDKNMILSNCYTVVPGLKNAPIIKHQVGLRPGRTSVRLELDTTEKSGNTILKIVHNYGHGGCGVTLCVGCAADATELVGSALLTYNSKL